MTDVKLSEDQALSSGAELWVISNDPSLNWWSQLDFLSGYLFSQNYFRTVKETPSELINIIEATNLETPTSQHPHNFVLLGTEDHFFNKWTLVWNNLNESQLAAIITDMAAQMNFSNVRLFSHQSQLLKALKTRQTASLLNISYIE
ncbi:MAG: hypothetical protein ACXVAX_01430 [Pseudobdellovibrio sp.]